MLTLLLMTLLSAESGAKTAIKTTDAFNPKLLRQTDQCASVTGERTVYLIKQWHLDPTVNTKDQKPKNPPPQAKNQIQIYDQLLEWQKNKAIDTVVAEGCEGGDIDEKFKPIFNGWSFQDLKAKSSDAHYHYEQILSHSVVKLEAKVGDAVHALCGDDLSEIKKSQVALSDARGDVGYLSRLSEFKDQPDRAKTYLEGTIEALKLKSDATAPEAIKALALDLKSTLSRFSDSTHERDLSFVRKIKQAKTDKPVVLVVGGLHASDLKQILEDKKLNCLIFEPVSYKNDEESLNQSLLQLIDRI